MYKFLSHEPLANKSCHHNHEEHSHEHHHSHADARSVDKKILKIFFNDFFYDACAIYLFNPFKFFGTFKRYFAYVF